MSKRNVVHLEIFADDRLATARFYCDLFGWDHRDFAENDYSTLATGNEEIAIGIGQRTAEQPGATTFYIESDDLAADLKAVEAAGGTMIVPPMEVPGVGSMAFFTDPSGNIMALGKFLPM
jgi:predicted enzyme related to lactoylglutathione lyase